VMQSIVFPWSIVSPCFCLSNDLFIAVVIYFILGWIQVYAIFYDDLVVLTYECTHMLGDAQDRHRSILIGWRITGVWQKPNPMS
jgi:hypothetical protein